MLALFLIAGVFIPYTLCGENITHQWTVQKFSPDCQCGKGSLSRSWGQRIAGGTQVLSEDEYPWHSAIRRYFFFVCSGALITDFYIVTAASCFFSSIGNRIPDHGLKVGVGVYKLFGDRTSRPYIEVEKVIIHRDYDPRLYVSDLDNNIALIRLHQPSGFEGSSPVCLPSLDNVNYDVFQVQALVTGWGSKRTTGTLNNVLQEVVVRIKSQCSSGTPTSVFCAEANPGRSVCKGDIGSPLLIEENGVKVLMGITITDMSCGFKESKFTSVLHFLDWIKNNVQDSQGCLKSP